MTTEEPERGGVRNRMESRIPHFASEAEAAEFWDTHDSADFEDEFEDVADVRFILTKPTRTITVRLEADALAALTQRAHEQGTRPSELVRTWILEHLRDKQSDSTPRAS